MHGRRFVCCFVLGLLLFTNGCSPFFPPQEDESPALTEIVPLSDQFDASMTGSIRGRVVWNGAVPNVEPVIASRALFLFQPAWKQRDKSFVNPHTPAIDESTQGIGGAVVFLRQVDPRRSKPWPHPPVSVALQEAKLDVLQGDEPFLTGFVRKGEAVRLLSREERFHIVRGDGADFFSLTLPQPDKERERVPAQVGRVELTSAVGYYWLRGHLFVSEHPYYTRTNTRGEFVLDQVPPGDYELVAWLPSWHTQKTEYDTESLVISRWFFQAPVEQPRRLSVTTGEVETVEFTFTAEMFAQD